MGVSLLEEPLPQKSVTKAGVGIRIIGLYLESFLPIRDCFVDAAFCEKNVSAVVIGICIIRLQFYCLLVVNHRFIGLSFSVHTICEAPFHKCLTYIFVLIYPTIPNPLHPLIVPHLL